MHNYSNMQNNQMIINACQILPFFQNFADSCLQNDPFFLISRIRASHWKNTPFFAKMGRSVVYVLVGSVCVWGGGGGGGGGYNSQLWYFWYHKTVIPGLTYVITMPAWCDDMVTPSLLLLLCERNPSIISGFPHSQEE